MTRLVTYVFSSTIILLTLALAAHSQASDTWFFQPGTDPAEDRVMVRRDGQIILQVSCSANGRSDQLQAEFVNAPDLPRTKAYYVVGRNPFPVDYGLTSAMVTQNIRGRDGTGSFVFLQDSSAGRMPVKSVAPVGPEGSLFAMLTLIDRCYRPVTSPGVPSFSCAPWRSPAEQIICRTTELATAERRVTDAYLSYAATLSEADAEKVWNEHAKFRQKLDDCRSDATCISGALAAWGDALAPLVPVVTATAAGTAPFDAAAALAEQEGLLQAYGVRNAMALAQQDGVTFVIGDVQQSGRTIPTTVALAIHDVAADVLIEPTAPLFQTIMATKFMPEIDRRTRVGSMALHHVIAGLPMNTEGISASRLASSPVPSVTMGHYALLWGGTGQVKVNDAKMNNATPPRSHAEAQAEYDMISGAAVAQAQAEQQDLAARRDTFFQAEAFDASVALSGGTVYRSPDFWLAFDNPSVVKGIFTGNWGATSERRLMQQVEGWTRAYADQCGDLLPEGSPELVTTDLLIDGETGAVKSEGPPRRFPVTRDFFPAVEAYVAYKNSSDAKLDEFEFGVNLLMKMWEVRNRSLLAPMGEVVEAAIYEHVAAHDMAVFVAKAGCESATTRQFSQNLVRAVTGNVALQMDRVAIPGAAEDSDVPPSGPPFASIALSCWDSDGYRDALWSERLGYCRCLGESLPGVMAEPELEMARSDFTTFIRALSNNANSLGGQVGSKCRSLLE